jgi:hypothetical protein
MKKPTEEVLHSLVDCVQFEGFTQGLSMLIQHKLTPEDKVVIMTELQGLLDPPTQSK